MADTDPIAALAVGVEADHKARQRAKKTAKPAEQAGAEAASEAQAAGSTDDEAKALGTVVEHKVEEAVEQSGGDPATASPEPTPAAPGDDPASVFDRRLARLNTLVDEAEFDSGTAFGDLRDCILDLFKHRPKLWSAMIPSEQQDVIRAVEASAREILGKVVLVIAQEDDDTIQGTLDKKWTVNGDAIELKVKLDSIDNDVLADVLKMSAHKVVLVSADSKRFMSARRVHNIGDDQTTMDFADPAPARTPAPAPAPNLTGPAGDDDLVRAADDLPNGDGEAQREDQDDWGVYDTDRREWLIDENGGDDGWTSNSADAGRWSHADAKRLAQDFADGGEGVVARQLHEAKPAE